MKTKAPNRRRGAVLLTALAFAVVIAFVLAGMATLTVSHFQRSGTEADYAAALCIAEGGINYELRKISQDPTTAAQKGAPDTGSITYTGISGSIPGTYSTYCTNDPDNGAAWNPPDAVQIWSKGTVNGVTASTSRTVRIRGKRKSIFDEFALFGILGSGFNGNYIIDGTYGSNQPISTSGNSSVIYGNVIYNGQAANVNYGAPMGWIGQTGSGSATGPQGQVFHQPDPVVWPTVSQIADAAARVKSGGSIAVGAGLTWFKNNNDNALIQVFTAADASNSNNPALRATTAINVNQLQTNKGGKTYWVLAKSVGSADNNPMDSPGHNPVRYVFPASTFSYINPSNSVSVASYGLAGNNVIILPGSGNPNVYRDYYFENIDISGNQQNVLIDTASGPIRIWLNASDNQYDTADDNLQNIIFTANTSSPIVTNTTNPSRFRLYDAKGKMSGGTVKGVLQVKGSNFFPGGIYDYNGSVNNQVSFTGGPVIYGSVVAGSFAGSGNPLIRFPNNAQDDSSADWSLWWGLRNDWTEINGAN